MNGIRITSGVRRFSVWIFAEVDSWL